MFTKFHRKWFTGFAILLSLVLVAVACGDSATSTPRPVAATAIPQPVAATAIPAPVAATAIPEPVAATAIPEPVAAPTVAAKQFEGQTIIVAAYAGPFLDTIRDVMGKKFEEDTGGQVDFVPVYGDYVTLIATAPANRPPYDVTVCGGPDLLRGLIEDVWLPLRKGNIPNAQDLNAWHTQTSGLGFEGMDLTYALPFEYVVMVMGYNKEVVPFEPTSWADLWRPEVQGLIGLDTVFHPINSAAAALILDGQPGLEELYNDEGISATIEKLQELDVALWYDVGVQATAAMQRGDIGIMIQAAELVSPLVLENPDKFGMVVPKEGSPGSVDYMCTVRGTEKRDMGEAFINYMLDPELQAQWAEEVPYWMSNSKAVYGPKASRLIPPTFAEREAIFLNQDWNTIVETWDAVDARYRKELYTK